jgi:hypothetical protein
MPPELRVHPETGFVRLAERWLCHGRKALPLREQETADRADHLHANASRRRAGFMVVKGDVASSMGGESNRLGFPWAKHDPSHSGSDHLSVPPRGWEWTSPAVTDTGFRLPSS